MKILISAGIMVIGIVFWFVGNFLLNIFELGPDPTYEFSPNYIMVVSTLCYFPQPTDLDNIEYPVEELVESFCVKNPWLLGKTEKGYFAINMDSHETYYPINTFEALTGKTGVQVLPEDWIDEHKERMKSKYLRRNPTVIIFGKIFNVFFWIIYVCLGVGLLFWIKDKPKKASIPKI